MNIKDTIPQILDSLQQHPIMKGAVPAVASVAVSLIDQIEVWLRVSGLTVGLLIGLITLYIKAKEAFKK